MRYKILLAILISSLSTGILTFSTTVYSKSKSEDTIKYRQSGMMFMRWNMSIIKKQTIKNPNSYNKAQVTAAENVINAISNSGIEKLFTSESSVGTGWKKTRAKSEIVSQTDKVRNYIARLSLETKKLVAVSNTGDISSIQKQFKNVLRTCKSCHKSYRNK